MYILSIESSCDETAVAVLRGEESGVALLSDVVASQADVHALYGGVVPEIASRAHTEVISRITYEALEKAGVSLARIGAVAVTDHPGLIGALLVGVNFGKALAFANRIPLVGVDHIKGHIAAAYLTESAPKPPFLAFVVSGGHTALYHVKSYTEHHLIGTTRDDAMGEAFDKVGRLFGLSYPAGAAFDRLSTEGFMKAVGKAFDPNENGESQSVREAYRAFAKSDAARLYKLPSPALLGDHYDFSFSGLKTAAVNLLHNAEQSGKALDNALFAAAYTYTAVEGAITKLSLALDAYPSLPLVLGGGVAANSHLRGAVRALCERKKTPLHILPRSLCGDNGAMIGAAGYYEFLAGNLLRLDCNASASDSL